MGELKANASTAAVERCTASAAVKQVGKTTWGDYDQLRDIAQWPRSVDEAEPQKIDR